MKRRHRGVCQRWCSHQGWDNNRWYCVSQNLSSRQSNCLAFIVLVRLQYPKKSSTCRHHHIWWPSPSQNINLPTVLRHLVLEAGLYRNKVTRQSIPHGLANQQLLEFLFLFFSSRGNILSYRDTVRMLHLFFNQSDIVSSLVGTLGGKEVEKKEKKETICRLQTGSSMVYNS